MTYKENITAILECYFTGFKEEIINSACNRILELEPTEWQQDHEILKAYSDGANEMLDEIRAEVESHCGLIKENHCKYCSYCNSVMGVREILEIIDKYKTESEG